MSYYQFDKPRRRKSGFFTFIGRVFLFLVIVSIAVMVLTANEAKKRIQSGYYSSTATPTIFVTLESPQGDSLLED